MLIKEVSVNYFLEYAEHDFNYWFPISCEGTLNRKYEGN